MENEEWWEGELEGNWGLFPSSYVKLLTDTGVSRSQSIASRNGGEQKSVMLGSFKGKSASISKGSTEEEPQRFSVWNTEARNPMLTINDQVDNGDDSGHGGNTNAGGGVNMINVVSFSSSNGNGKYQNLETQQQRYDPSKPPPNSLTRTGLYATYLARYAAVVNILMGISLVLWGLIFPVKQVPRLILPVVPFTLRQFIIGGYGIFYGFCVLLFECTARGITRKGGRMPWRALVYVLGLGPLCMELPTAVGAAVMLLSIIMNIWSGKRGEFYTPPNTKGNGKNAKGKEALLKPKAGNCCSRCLLKVGGSNPSGRCTRIFFAIFYTLLNIAVGAYWSWSANEKINKARREGTPALSRWVPVAKWFGGMMCLNFSMLLIPVSRTFIRLLYDHSIDNSTRAKCIRVVFLFIPLDHVLGIHATMGYLGAFAAAMHVFAHVVDYGTVPEEVWEIFGPGVWVSGTLLTVILMLLIPATHRPVKSGQFEIFWATHNLFWFFFPLVVIHGENFIGPSYWKLVMLPGAIYVCERVYRYLQSHRKVAIVSATFMGEKVISLEFTNKAFKNHYKEGQYAYICCPYVSKYEWHPFTISSAPQESTTTFHIRIQAEGSWTHQTRDYLRLLSGNKVYQHFSHFVANSAITTPGKFEGPDGKRLFYIYGPCSAPTQHLSEYNEVCQSAFLFNPFLSIFFLFSFPCFLFLCSSSSLLLSCFDRSMLISFYFLLFHR